MKQNYVSDHMITFSLQGLRWVSKRNQIAWGSAHETYFLDLEYKGSRKEIEYSSKEERDSIYELARSLLSPSEE